MKNSKIRPGVAKYGRVPFIIPFDAIFNMTSHTKTRPVTQSMASVTNFNSGCNSKVCGVFRHTEKTLNKQHDRITI